MPQRIVILPFENLGPPEDEYFADGVTEEITSRLSAVSGLSVISRTTATQYKESRPPLAQIGRDLNVDYALEGTVRWARIEGGQSRVRITPQLIRVSDDTHLWSDSYDRVLDDIFTIQSDLAQQVLSAMNIALLDSETSSRRGAAHPESGCLSGLSARQTPTPTTTFHLGELDASSRQSGTSGRDGPWVCTGLGAARQSALLG